MPITGDYEPSPSEKSANQVDLFERTGGAEGNTEKGRPIIVLTTIGAKSGKVRKTPLMRVEHEGVYAVVGSMGGAPTDPLWCRNLVAHPQVELQDGAEKHEYVAHRATGEERAVWWERAVAAFPPYADYQISTTRDEIPLYVLEPADR